MKGSALKKQELIDLLKTRVPADQASKVESVVTGMVDAIREEVIAEFDGFSDESIREQIQNLTEARDEAAERARNAEAELAELSRSVETQIEAAKKAVREEFKEEIDFLNERLEETENEKDQIAARIQEDAEKEFESFKSELVTKISRFMEGKMNGVYDRLQEAVASDPTALHESNTFRQIAELVAQHKYDETAAAVGDRKVEAIHEEVVGLRAQVRQLEARNARLTAETKILREGSGIKENGRFEETPTYSGKAYMNPSAGLANKYGNAETDDQYEPEGNVRRYPHKAKMKNEGTSESERVRDLLSEAFTSDEESFGAHGEGAGWISSISNSFGAQDEDNGWNRFIKESSESKSERDGWKRFVKDSSGSKNERDGWKRFVKNSRRNRSERASVIEGRGLGIRAEDVIREDTGAMKGKRLDENVIVPGTSTTRSEFAQLAGIASDAE